MSRFPKADLEALKATIDLVAVVGAVAQLEKRGADLVCRCPLPGHDDKTASFHVTPTSKLWHCFGCGRGGDVIEFVMEHQGVSFREAVERLRGAPLSSTPQAPTSTKQPPSPLSAEQLETLAKVAGFYASTLKEVPEARTYLEKRGISVEAAEHFQLGYANRKISSLLSPRNTPKGRAQREKLMDAGVVRERTGLEHLNGCVVVPLQDEQGRVVGMYGRKLRDAPKHIYLEGPHRGVFNAGALSSSTEVILCEALIDALTFWSAGHRNVTSSFGADGFTAEMLAAFKRAGIQTVLVAYDNDEGGNSGAAKVTQILEREGFVVGRVRFPEGKDANEHARGSKSAAEALATVIDSVRAELRPRSTTTTTTASAAPEETTKKAASPALVAADQHEAIAQVTAYYCSTLKDSPEALQYLEKRGLMSSEMIDHFQLGYANRTLGLRLSSSSGEVEELRGLLTEAGVFRRESGHEHLSGSLVVPIKDEQGHVVELYGRKIHHRLRQGTPVHLYLRDEPRDGVFNADALSSSTEVILCEALIDALTFWCAGYRNVTSSFGADGFTDEMLSAFKRAGIRSVLVAYDHDEDGEKGAARVKELLEREGFVVGRVVFPRNRDANEYALRVQPATKSLGLLLERARDALLSSTKGVASFTSATKDVKAKEPQSSTETPAPLPLAAPATPSTPAERELPRPPTSRLSSTMEVSEDEIVFTLGDRRYRVRGFEKNTSKGALKVNLLASRGDAFHVDTLDLYIQRFRQLFHKMAAHELRVDENTIKNDVGHVLLRLEALQDGELRKLLSSESATPEMTEEEKQQAISLLRDPHLLDRVLEDFTKCGVVGEETNKLMGYLGMTSRKLKRPLAIIIQSLSAAGKSSLMDAVIEFCPEEEKIKYSAMTGQSLFYMKDKDLKHKVLAIVEEEGAEKASYSLKLLQSEGELIIASTGKDPETGQQMTVEYKVEGPVMLFLTTTSSNVDEELLNRCLMLTIDEDREQTRAIHRLQRERRTLAGQLLGEERGSILKLHQNAQRLLEPVVVVNPYADQLTFVDDKTRTRRDHVKYLSLIDTIAFVHQHQREVKTVEHKGKPFEFIEVTVDDIALANKITHVVLGRSLDELPPQARKLLDVLDAYVSQMCAERAMQRSDVRLTRREILDVSGMGYTQLSIHMERLIAVEHVLVHAGQRGRSFVYELLFDGGGKGGAPHVSGLIDVEKLRPAGTMQSSRGVLGSISAPSRPVLGGGAENSVVDEKPASEPPKTAASSESATGGSDEKSSHHELSSKSRGR